MFSFAVAAVLASTSPVDTADYAWKEGEYKVLENSQFKLYFRALGGSAMSIWSKAVGAELTDPSAAGCFTEMCWNVPKSRDFLLKKPYAMTYRTGANGEIVAEAVGNAQGGDINFLKVIRRMSSTDDSTALSVDYRFENIPEAMSLVNYAPLVHTTLGVFGRDVTCFYPLEDGIKVGEPGKRGNEFWLPRAGRGWMAAATADGVGVALTMPYRDINAFYSWFSHVPTLEWRMIPFGLEAGAHYDVHTEVIPFKGLMTVSGAGGGLVGELRDGVCRVVNARAGTVVAEADGQKTELAFAKPGDLREFKTSAKLVVLLKDGKEACRLDAAPDAGDWQIVPTEKPRVSSIKEADLNCYTNFPPSGAYAWAKPLAGGKLKVSFVTGLGNQIEVGRLVERLDCDYRTAWAGVSGREKRAVSNPVYGDGDNFGLINAGDSENAIKKSIGWESDAIVLGGFPFDALPAFLRKLLVERVKKGAGLVLLGPDRSIPEFGLKVKGGYKRLVPHATDAAFADVAFGLLCAEPVNEIDPSGWTVHAACKDRPYVLERTVGKGRVVVLPYLAAPDVWSGPVIGLTPDLSDFYPDRIAPVEHYYSLIAKAITTAAGRKLPLAFGTAIVNADKATFEATAAESGDTDWEWRAVSPFGDVLAKGVKKVTLAKGENAVMLDALAIPPFAGQLSFEVTVRQAGAVLNWGAWEFAHATDAAIMDVKLDQPYHREGDEVKVEVKGLKVKGCGLRMRVVDSYGRLVEEGFCASLTSGRETASTFETASTLEAKWAFKVENALPARCYDVIAEVVDAKGAVVARRKAELRVRPSREKLVWDDFEVGTWVNANTRRYLWPELGKALTDGGVDTVIANPPRAEIDLPIRYNMHPTILSDAGLGRSGEPDAYSKTGDKLKLVRGRCLSEPKFFAGRDKAIARQREEFPKYGLRFVWFGDEQSLTGYGGAPIDFCFSTNCLAAFRAFAKAKYGTLEKLNAEYESNYKTWDEVLPYTRQEVWNANGKHVAGWADHLEFMDSRLTNSVAYSVSRLRAADPDLRFALSGTQAPSAYGGMDWWKILGTLDCALSYGTGGQHEIHRSFSPDGCFMPWSWGYSGRGDGAVDRCWVPLFYGCRGIIGFQSSSQWRPDLTPSFGLADTLPHILRMKHGVGKHILCNLVTRPDVAILYSQASHRAAFIENRRKAHDGAQEKFRKLLLNLGVSYDYVSGEQLAAGVAEKRGYRALLLVDAAAMDETEIAGVKAFAAAGGTVIAEGLPGRLQQNCRARAASPLEGLFADGRHTLVKALPEDGHAAFSSALQKAGVGGEKLTMLADGKEILDFSVFAKADRAGNPFWGVRPTGKRRAVTFKFPKKGFVYELVNGKSYGAVDTLTLTVGLGTPLAFVQLPEETGVGEVKAEGARITVRGKGTVDSVVRVRVFDPSGREAEHYAKNLVLKAGETATYEIPFARNDAKGRWTVQIESVFGGVVRAGVQLPLPPASVSAMLR